MPKTLFRNLLFPVVLTCLGIVFFSVSRDAAAQKQPPVPVPPVQVDPNGNPVATETTIEKFNFPEDRDTSLKFEAVLDYMDNKKTVDWAVVCKLVQGLLGAKSDYFYKFEKGERAGSRVSVKEEVSRIIGTFPKDGHDFYEQTFGNEAQGELNTAKAAGYDPALLAGCSQKYFYTKAGVEATILLARVNLEFGNFPQAAYCFQRLMARPDADTILDVRAMVQAVVALKRGGESRRPEEINILWAKIEKKYPRDGLAFGNKSYSFEKLKAEVDVNIEFLYGKVGDAYIAMKGGNISRNGIADAGAPFLDALFSLPVLYRTEDANQKAGADWVRTQIDSAYKRFAADKKKVYIPAFFPVTAPNMILFRGYDGTYAFYTKDGVDTFGKPYRIGDIAWFAPSYGAVQTVFAGEEEKARGHKQNMQNWWTQYWSNNMPSILFENSLLGSLSHDGKLVYGVDDLAVLPPPVQMQNEWGGFQPGGQPGNTAKDMQDFNTLVAVDIESGMKVWGIGGIGIDLKPEDENKITTSDKLAENSYFLGAPLPVNGKLFVLMERGGHLKMACLDPQKLIVTPALPGKGPSISPELVWVQNLGRANTTLKQDPLRRMQASFMASADGIIICPTNSGAVIAVDINARSLLWAHTYAASERANEIGGNTTGNIRRGRPYMPQGNPIPNERWRASNPIIVNGRVVLSAFDSESVQCLDLRSGKVLWSDARRPDDLYVGGVVSENVIIVGKNSVRAVKLIGEKPDAKTGRETVATAWQDLKIGTPVGHGTPSKDGLYYLPVIGDPDKPDSLVPAVWAINAETGAAKSKTQFRRKEGAAPIGASADARQALGNLVFHDGMMFSQSASEVSAFPLIEVKKREMDALLAKNPNDPDGLTSRGELFLDEGKLNEAIADLKRAQANKPSESTLRKIQQKLYISYTEVLRSSFDAGEKYLDEYKNLCEFAIVAEEGEPERIRQIEEQTRRKGLYYSLVAKGREKQGKLVDAFDNYRAYASLGEQGRLLSVPEDPNTQAIPAVWASGRIEAMMRNAKNASARKPLEEKVEAEWQTVKNGNDLVQLENFVRTFGPYFASGREAQFLISERLMLTNNDSDKRKAQSYLINLIAQADASPENLAPAARATEALARLLTSRNMMDDAVGLYARLGNTYSEVVIRDGKTGADIYGDLITDKRLLPYLEPARSVMLSNYRVDAQQGNNQNQARTHSLTLAPDGDLFPYFKRHRISLDYDMNTGLSAINVLDRISGENQGKLPITNMQNFQNWNNGNNQNPASLRIAQASGHLFLVNVGNMVYCVDLSQKSEKNQLKELWKVNLFGNDANIQNGLQMEAANDGDTIYRSQDGWAFRLGRSAVLQSSYACVLTRDGLVVMDPATGAKLWTRNNVSAKASIYGDARHIYLVEAGTGGTTARVLRAADGVTVEGVKDFAPLMSGPNRIAAFGRQILLSEPATEGKLRHIRLYDILEGKDVWSKEYPADSVPLKSYDPEFCGIVTPEGKIQILASRTGKVLLDSKVDPKQMAEHLQVAGKFALLNPVLLADGERFYTFLNRDDKGQINPANIWGNAPIRTLFVNGACYCFDRNTGKRIWYTDDQFLRQQICLERFEEMPCVFATNPAFMEPNGQPNRGGAYTHKIVAIDKKTGILKLMKEGLASQGPFQALTHNPRDGSFEFWQYNLSVKIKPEDAKK